MSLYPITSCTGLNGRSMVFYVDSRGFIRYYYARDSYEIQESDVQKRRDYTENSITQNNADVKTQSKDLDALYYEIGGTHYIRLYYADQNGLLMELCMDLKQGEDPDDKDWIVGALGALKIRTVANTPISAHINEKDVDKDKRSYSSLKVYYYHPDDSGSGGLVKPRVAWVKLGNKDWQQSGRVI